MELGTLLRDAATSASRPDLEHIYRQVRFGNLENHCERLNLKDAPLLSARLTASNGTVRQGFIDGVSGGGNLASLG
jgi:hypothetical protein